MTLKPLTLDEYFHLIITNQPQKEKSMFNKTKEYLVNLKERLTLVLAKPTPAEVILANRVDMPMEEDYWSFEMVTQEWYSSDRDEVVPTLHTIVVNVHEGTWHGVLDKIITEMEKHYGYSIKEQVYYSVAFPLNDPFIGDETNPNAGRMLNDTVLQQLLLSFPEVYANRVPEDYTLTGGANL